MEYVVTESCIRDERNMAWKSNADVLHSSCISRADDESSGKGYQ